MSVRTLNHADCYYVWRTIENRHFFVMHSKYFDCINYDNTHHTMLCGHAGTKQELSYRADIFIVIFASLNTQATNYIDYFTKMYEILNERLEH